MMMEERNQPAEKHEGEADASESCEVFFFYLITQFFVEVVKSRYVDGVETLVLES